MQLPKCRTATGLGRSVVVPSPTCPCALYPQHHTLPSDRRAQVRVSPVESSTALEKSTTGVGLSRVSVLPSPRLPCSFQPQQRTRPFCSRAQL
jgi:hypothetical protein